MRISKPLALVIGFLTIWPLLYMVLLTGFLIFFGMHIAHQAQLHHADPAQMHHPDGAPGFLLYIFIPHLATILLIFALIAFYIIHVFKNGALKDDRRILWAVVLFMGTPISAPIYWWFYVRPRASSNVAI